MLKYLFSSCVKSQNFIINMFDFLNNGQHQESKLKKSYT